MFSGFFIVYRVLCCSASPHASVLDVRLAETDIGFFLFYCFLSLVTGGEREFSSPGSKATISLTGIPCLWNHGGDGDLTWRDMHGRREREERERECSRHVATALEVWILHLFCMNFKSSQPAN